jgi:hypothetical protein
MRAGDQPPPVRALRAGDVEKAVRLLRGAVETDPTYAAGHFNLACAYARQGNKPAMLESIKLALKYGKETAYYEKLGEELGRKSKAARRGGATSEVFSRFKGD